MTTKNRSIEKQEPRDDVVANKQDNIDFSLAPDAVQKKLHITVDMTKTEFNNYAHTVIDGAIKNYGDISGKKGKKDKSLKEKGWATVAAIGTLGSTSRKDRVVQRVEDVHKEHPDYSDVLLLLLQDNKTGNSLKSFRYMLATNYLGSNAKTDGEAAEQIVIATKELDACLEAKRAEWLKLVKSVENKAGRK